MSLPGPKTTEDTTPLSTDYQPLAPPGVPPPDWCNAWPAVACPPGMQPMPVPSDSIPAAWGGVPADGWAGYSMPEVWGGLDMAAGCPPCNTPPDQQALEQWQQCLQWQQWQQYEVALAAQQQATGSALYHGYPYQQAPLFAISPPSLPHRAHQKRLARKPKAALLAEPSFGSDAEGGALLFSGEPSQAELGEAGADCGAPATTALSGRPPRPHRRSHSASGALPASAAAFPSALQFYPSVAYDRAPRPVQFKPYTFADYQQRGYDVKASSKFWTLGGLGPAHGGSSFASSTSSDSSEGGTPTLQGDALWQAQQQKRERQQQFGQTASQQNRVRLATMPPRHRAPSPRPGTEVRERALRFAQSGVPKPSSFRGRDPASLEGAAAAAALAQHAAQEGTDGAAAAVPAEETAANELSSPAAEEVEAQLQALQLGVAPAKMAIAPAADGSEPSEDC